ncbi:MAG: Glu/Leu/Phe/Val dehydrogenase [Candidatus Dadabacteria bacterium]|nr:Glu/Leu/Phe/Val dehydrogenase [Candidatus Dadabacteria bacterium]NIS10099.1 Glu/Leu/Phe/Val dehydrogenase [Candidatus Dadabacteria bacterium]NIY23040.1 Glu/Leu/Phe/Val dehydrogenase [Candidatus Dadabacteria bacterium]
MKKDEFRYADDLGPMKIIQVYEPTINLKAILVVDNVAMGPSIGGLRMAPDVSTEECFRLARAMTLKNAAANLKHGGGKSVIFGDPSMDKSKKENLMRCLAKALRGEEEYIFGPDMGTNEECMAWVRDEIGRSVGLPREIGGIPLDEIGATGWGVSHASEVASEFCDFKMDGARFVVQGFGAVGKHSARFLSDMGAVMVAASDSKAAVYDPDGLDVNELIEHKNSGLSLSEYKKGKILKRDDVIEIECEIWIPAARPDVINEKNVEQMNTKLIVAGANIPATTEAEKILYKKGVINVPDFIANAGGVICAAMEYQGATESSVFESIKDKIRRNTRQVLEDSENKKITPRQAAIELATARVKKAMEYRRFSAFSSAPKFI